MQPPFETWSESRKANESATALLAALLCLAGCSEEAYSLGGRAIVDAGEREPIPETPRFGLCRWGEDDLEFIDDMEDGDATIDFTEGRAGSWFAFNDQTSGGAQRPRPGSELFTPEAVDPPRAGSRMATHSSGSGFVDWGAGVGFELRSQAYYDARDYAGIAFWARAGSAAEQDLRVEVTDRNTSPLGMLCTPRDDEGQGGVPNTGYECHDNFGVTLELTEAWQAFVFFWDELSQRNWSGQMFEAIDTEAIYGFRFQAIQLDEQVPKPDFDFWIDDVSFICPTLP